MHVTCSTDITGEECSKKFGNRNWRELDRIDLTDKLALHFEKNVVEGSDVKPHQMLNISPVAWLS